MSDTQTRCVICGRDGWATVRGDDGEERCVCFGCGLRYLVRSEGKPRYRLTQAEADILRLAPTPAGVEEETPSDQMFDAAWEAANG